MTSALVPDGYRYVREGDPVESGDQYWSWEYEVWKEVKSIIGHKAKAFHVIRKITGNYTPQTKTEETW